MPSPATLRASRVPFPRTPSPGTLRRCLTWSILTAGLGCMPPAITRDPSPSPAPPAAGPIDPGMPLSPRQQRWVDSTLGTLSLREQVGQLVMPWVLGDYTHQDAPAFAQIRRWITEDRIGGVVMSLGSPVEVAAKVNAMQQLAAIPMLVASDVEPGLGRLEGGVFAPSLMQAGSATVLPSNMAIAAAGSVELAREAGRIVGREARAVGIHLAFAPTVDVNNNPENPVINVRSFGEDPAEVAAFSAAFVTGVQSEGVAATVKHFPGHGDTDTDSHLALPVVPSDPARLRAVELVPFERTIAAGAAAVMTAHVALPAIGGDSTPATLRPAIMTGLLRDSLGFTGLTVTDALTMQGIGRGYTTEESVVLALEAGSDILLMPDDVRRAIDAVVAAVESGRVPASRLEASARRVLEWKVRTGAVARPMVSLDTLRAVVGAPAHWRTADSIATRAVTLLRDRGNVVPLAAAAQVTVLTYAPELDIVAGRAFAAELRAHFPRARIIRLGARPDPELAQLAAALDSTHRVIVTTHVRTIEGEGRFAVPPAIASFVDSLAQRVPTIVVAHGNPYVLRQFPSVSGYLATYGRGEALERAAARAVSGVAPIGGRAPISLPGYFSRGDGLARSRTR